MLFCFSCLWMSMTPTMEQSWRENKMQCSVEAKHLSFSFFLLCVLQKIKVVLILCCFTNGKNVHICILVVLCIFCQEFCCTRELVNMMILDAIESVEAFNGIDERL